MGYWDEMPKPLPRREVVQLRGAEYVRWYEKGWRYSNDSRNDGRTIDAAPSGRVAGRAWEDAYLDAAAGRPKWHYANCDGECGYH